MMCELQARRKNGNLIVLSLFPKFQAQCKKRSQKPMQVPQKYAQVCICHQCNIMSFFISSSLSSSSSSSRLIPSHLKSNLEIMIAPGSVKFMVGDISLARSHKQKMKPKTKTEIQQKEAQGEKKEKK